MRHILLIATAALLATGMHAHAKARHHVAHHHAASIQKVHEADSLAPKHRLAHRYVLHAHLPHG